MTDFHTESVVLPHEQNLLVVCNSEETSFFGQPRKCFHFSFSPSASMEEVRELLAAELSLEPACVHLQVLVRASNEYETVTRGSVADALALSNSESNTLTVVYSTENRYGCFYICCAALCAACCAAGYAAGKSNQKEKQRRRPPPPQQHQHQHNHYHNSQPYGNNSNTNCAQYPQAAPANQYYQNTNAQPPQTYAYGSPVQYTPQPQQSGYPAAQPNGYGAPPQQYQNYGGNQAPAPL